MAVTKTDEIGRLEVVGEHKHIQIRTDSVFRDGTTELPRSYHRESLSCGKLQAGTETFVETDVSSKPSEVQELANLVWTQAVKNSYRDYLIAEKNKALG